MQPSDRKKYLNPPILDATCEFVFAEPAAWDVATPAAFYKYFKDEYDAMPRIESVPVPDDKKTLSIFAIPPEQQIAFATTDQSREVVINRRQLNLKVAKPYDGWERFLDRINAVIAAWIEIIGDSIVARISLKYENFFPKHMSVSGEPFFNIAAAFPEALNLPVSKFYEAFVLKDEPHGALLTVSFLGNGDSGWYYGLDIAAESIEPVDRPLSSIAEILGNLKTSVTSMFESAITDALRKQLGVESD